jgi:hypothetical protein
MRASLPAGQQASQRLAQRPGHAALASANESGDEERSRLRSQALRWLRADLDDWSAKVNSGPGQVRRAARAFLASAKTTPALASIRDKGALDKPRHTRAGVSGVTPQTATESGRLFRGRRVAFRRGCRVAG